MIGEVEKEDGVLVIKRIHVRYHVKAAAAKEAEVRRAFEAHPPSCPVYRTICECVDITTELVLEAEGDA